VDPPALNHTKAERLIVLSLGVLLAAAMVFIVIGQVPIGSQKFAIVRVLLALMAGAIGAFMPGAFLEVEGKPWGLPLRAGGAAAFFFIVLWVTPGVDAPLQMLPIAPDIRSQIGAAEGPQYRRAPSAMVLPIAFLQDGQAPTLKISRMTATLDFAGDHRVYKPIHVTELSQGSTSTGWLPNKGNITMPLTIPSLSNAVEIAFYDANPDKDWQSMVTELARASLLKVRVDADTDQGSVSKECLVDMAGPARRIVGFAQKENRPVQRLTLECMQ
jgi:hypothetical protein